MALCPDFTASTILVHIHLSSSQVGTSDGRVKLIGAVGVEPTLQTPSCSPTMYLEFLENRGALVRVTQASGVGGERESGYNGGCCC